MDPERLGRLLDANAAALGLYAAQWSAAADDVVQEAFVRLVAADPPPDRPVPWLYKVVRNLALDDRRADRRRRRRETLASRLAPADEGGAGSEAVEIADALESLPDDVREVVVAHLWGGLTFAEIGDLDGTSSSSAHRRYGAGLTALRRLLDQPCPNQTT